MTPLERVRKEFAWHKKCHCSKTGILTTDLEALVTLADAVIEWKLPIVFDGNEANSLYRALQALTTPEAGT